MADLKDHIDAISKINGIGDLTRAQSNAYYGFNHQNNGNALPINTDQHGLTFFTRPRLNLSYDNIAGCRVLTPMLTDKEDTIQRAVRVMLDHRGADDGVTCPFVDNLSAFIPILTNTLLSISGWPDVVVDTYTSTPGLMKEEWGMVDSQVKNFGAYTLTANFRNIAGDPLTLLFNNWITYASQVYLGDMLPYPDSIIENRIDYNTRIYRLVLDPSKQFVQKIGACGAAFPTASPLGAAFNFDTESPFSTGNDQISIPFQCYGAMYLDPLLIESFNQTVVMFNPAMADDRRGKGDGGLRQITAAEKDFFNYRGYPRIDPYSSELQWWIDSATAAKASVALEEPDIRNELYTGYFEQASPKPGNQNTLEPGSINASVDSNRFNNVS